MRLRLSLLVAAVAGSLLPVAGAASPACAAPDSAALVVDTGAEVLSYCVALPASSVSGLDVIELAHEQHGLPYRFGQGGGAVCMLAGVGTEGDDCFGDYPDFWGYWRGDGSGGWGWSSTGAGSTSVSAGDVEGWAWGEGDTGESHPAPPATEHGAVCADDDPSGAGPPGTSSGPGSTAGEEPPPGTTQGSGSAPVVVSSPGTTLAEARRQARVYERRRRRALRAARRGQAGREDRSDDDPVVEVADAPAAPPEELSGPPVEGLAAVALTGAVGAAALWMRRRRPGA